MHPLSSRPSMPNDLNTPPRAPAHLAHLHHNPSDPFDLHSKETRSYYRQCQKCWKRKADGVKLSVCSSCKITSYCSVQCQKADWAFHKDACRSNKAFRAMMARQDTIERIESEVLGLRPPRPPSMLVNQEMSDFQRRFRPQLCQASYRCFGIQQGNATAWSTYVFFVRIERLTNYARDARTWARYKVVDAYKKPLVEVKRMYGEGLEPTLKQGEVYHEENVRVGCIGTIMTFLECDSTGHDIRFVSWAGYGAEAWDDEVPCADWKKELIESVEKGSGRSSS